MSAPILGIDLGTTYSLVSVLQAGVPLVLSNALGEKLTPSAVSVDADGTFLVGAPARARATTHPAATALAFKRDMGTTRTYRLGDHELTPIQLSALVLRHLREVAETALGMPIAEAVVTVPAYFGDAQRNATRDAGRLAGLTVERIINEPTAAALAYGLHQRDREIKAVVLDLGGGTFDVTVLEIIEGVIEIQSSAGDARLGGEDFDDLLAAHLASQAREAGVHVEDAEASARLRVAAEAAKRRLSNEAEAPIALPGMPGVRGRVDFAAKVSRAEAEELWAPLVPRLRGPILRALHDAKRRPEDIDEVLLVGGSTRMPLVGRLAAELFSRIPLRTLPPDEAVAMGAAIQAALKAGDASIEDVVVTDVAPFSLGVEITRVHQERQVAGFFSPILERGTVIPASREATYHPIQEWQDRIELKIYQGEHALVRDNQPLGTLLVKGIPPMGQERGVTVRFTYDLNGILEVDATVLSTGATTQLVVESGTQKLDAKALTAARKAMAKLKVHPAELLPNQTALARADALFVELRGELREYLGGFIADFRLALDRQDPPRIDEARERLNAVRIQIGQLGDRSR
ncbi:MAG: Hsp70 family protein [Myxococcales bacterium]|nr:Hsp70 family protein [Myxococcales bacterium]